MFDARSPLTLQCYTDRDNPGEGRSGLRSFRPLSLPRGCRTVGLSPVPVRRPGASECSGRRSPCPR